MQQSPLRSTEREQRRLRAAPASPPALSAAPGPLPLLLPDFRPIFPHRLQTRPVRPSYENRKDVVPSGPLRLFDSLSGPFSFVFFPAVLLQAKRLPRFPENSGNRGSRSSSDNRLPAQILSPPPETTNSAQNAARKRRRKHPHLRQLRPKISFPGLFERFQSNIFSPFLARNMRKKAISVSSSNVFFSAAPSLS